MRIDKNSPWYLVLMAITGSAVFCIVLVAQPRDWTDRILHGQNDFLQLYAGARLNGTPELYSRAANQRIHLEVGGIQADSLSHHSRLPFYSFFLKPLAFLPYRTAYYSFEAISLFSLLFFVWMFLPGCREIAAFASLSIPVFANLQNGQDATLCLMFAGLSIFLVRRNLDFWAGFALAFCAIKFHLFFLIPLIVILQRRWLILAGALTNGAILLAISFLRAGIGWPQAYFSAMRDPDLHPNPELMPTLHTVSAFLSGPADFAVELGLSVAVIIAVIHLARKTRDYELAFSFGLIGSLLVAFHAYTQDCVLLLLTLAIMLGNKALSKGTRGLTELAASPFPYVCVLAGVPFNIVMPALLMSILVMAVRSV
jgi:hypothetical protein